eukprot:33801-Rhodomonas_salina.4
MTCCAPRSDDDEISPPWDYDEMISEVPYEVCDPVSLGIAYLLDTDLAHPSSHARSNRSRTSRQAQQLARAKYHVRN